ncbi:MAG: NUDIX hydrolase [Bacteroidetes bacterium]|nr:NUDIX hydrolase [Bacteroidota bacterium]
MHPILRFNIRVYGILFNEKQQVLLADEVFKSGIRATKFPGGGLELGEGIADCLIREFKEEAGIHISLKEHFYTNDFFVPSFFDSESQIISIYYIVHSNEHHLIRTATQKFNFETVPGQEAESFRWVSIHDLVQEDHITLPIDKVVVKKLLESMKRAD